MKDALKQSWWKILAYTLAASLLSFYLEVRIGAKFAIITLPDGSVSTDHTRWLLLSGCIFVIFLLIGGLVFFRKLSRKELFYSASVMVAVDIAGTLISNFTQRTPAGAAFAVYFSEFTSWNDFVADVLLNVIGLNPWISTIFAWSIPYLFVLFGKKTASNS